MFKRKKKGKVTPNTSKDDLDKVEDDEVKKGEHGETGLVNGGDMVNGGDTSKGISLRTGTRWPLTFRTTIHFRKTCQYVKLRWMENRSIRIICPLLKIVRVLSLPNLKLELFTDSNCSVCNSYQ